MPASSIEFAVEARRLFGADVADGLRLSRPRDSLPPRPLAATVGLRRRRPRRADSGRVGRRPAFRARAGRVPSEHALDRPTTVEAVAFDPFRLRLTLRKLVVGRARGNGLALLVRRAGGRRVDGVALASRAGARRAQDRSSELLAAARPRGALQHPGPDRCPDGQAHRGAARFRSTTSRSTTASPSSTIAPPAATTSSRRSTSPFRSSRRCPTRRRFTSRRA